MEILVVVHRSGLQYIQKNVFDDLAMILERGGTYSAPVYLAAAFHIRLDRHDDPNTDHFRSLLDAGGMSVACCYRADSCPLWHFVGPCINYRH
jgi:hypothetical protein